MPDSNSGSVGETGQAPELDMPPVPCPDCMKPTDFVADSFVCRSCGGIFANPHGLDMLMWRRLWVAWTAGRTVVQLPEPDETYTDSILRARWSLCTAIVGGRGPKVNVLGGPYLDPGVAESRGTELIAAARLARRLAAESSGDGAE